MPRITTNFIYNVALTLSTYLINLILFPYVSRVLGVDLVGKVGFVNDTVTYFSLFAMMGIATVGIREIAACGEDREKRSRVFSSLMAIILLFTAVVLAVYLAAILVVDRFQADRDLFVMGAGTLVFTSFLIEWFYQGMEDFRYITLRSVAIKLAYALMVFLFVRKPGDYRLYFMLTVGMVVLNSLINLAYSRRFVRFSFRNASIRGFLKPVLSLGLYKVMISMYTTFNVIYLGFVASEAQVGYYYSSKKLFYIILGLFSAFTAVMLPRMSAILEQGQEEEFRAKTRMTFDIVFAFAFPLIVYFELLAPELIGLLSGPGYEGAILPMRIISPVLLLSAMAQVWVIQILMPLRKDRVVLLSSVAGAVVGILANILLVGRLGAVGSALVLLVSEIAGNLYSFVYSIRKGYLKFPVRSFLAFLMGALAYVLCCLSGKWISGGRLWVTLGVSAVLCLAYFLFFNLFIYKESQVSGFLRKALLRRA